MHSILVAALLGISGARLAAAQAYNQTTWGAVVMAFHGERLPLIETGSPSLTAYGAQQAVEAGSVIRTRFVNGPDTNLTRSYPIRGLNPNIIDNSQLYLLAAEDDYVAGSAQAFMQGVYPPLGNVGNASQFVLADGTIIDFPLNGYQYPTINTLSPLDFNFIWIAGNVDCPQYDLSTFQYYDTQDYKTTSADYDVFYSELVPTVFEGVVPPSEVSYYNAYSLWDYANYEYNHNTTIAATLSPVYLQTLRDLASQYEFAMNGDLSSSGLTHGDNIRAISGRTFATEVLSLLSTNIASGGLDPKLSVLFGGYPPFLAFASLAGLADEQNGAFTALPLGGSVMAFELFSNTPDNVTYPDIDDLWVRFLYRNGTNDNDASDGLVSYPLFGRGNSEVDMRWSDFAAGMNSIAIDGIADWCVTCHSAAMFCPSFTNNDSSQSGSGSSSSGSKKALSAPVAGVIGAVVTLCVLGLAIAAAMLLLGMRVHRRNAKHQSSLGGFKGAEKLASDTDLTLSKGKAGGSIVRHERVGSWELEPAGKGVDDETVVGSSKHQSLDRVVSNADYSEHDDDEIARVNPFGDPVKIDDRI